jgi:hypothetical protein
MDSQTLAIAAVVILAVIAIAFWLWNRQQQSKRLEQRFGPEYNRTVENLGDRTKAEAELRDRERRVEKLELVPLAPADAARYSQEWKTIQGRFVDNPKGVLMDADQLVREVMTKRGYPMGNFDRRAADVSVHHPHVVEHYRAAQAIALRDRTGEANTEELRQAVVHYRALFDELLEVAEPTHARADDHMEVH